MAAAAWETSRNAARAAGTIGSKRFAKETERSGASVTLSMASEEKG